jgi:hypothetical protein
MKISVVADSLQDSIERLFTAKAKDPSVTASG